MMKRILIMTCVLAAVAWTGCRAQGLSVSSFRLLENDLTAMLQGTSRTDQNGETAALIKIVTPERELTFDGGTLGTVYTDLSHPGEVWLYVPGYAQRLTIGHAYLGTLRDWAYPITVESGRTYELVLDIGTGRYVTIAPQVEGAEVEIDGKYAGRAPLYNRYMTFGPHTVSAVNGRCEGSVTVTVSRDMAQGATVSVPMRDMSDHYGTVAVTVDNRADIFFRGRRVGTGSWTAELKEGQYTVETGKADCDSAQTSFTVTAGQRTEVTATPPTPHTGYLHVYTRPRAGVRATLDGTQLLDLSEPVVLPVGRHEVRFAKKGYDDAREEYTLVRNETVRDTVTLQRTTYVKPVAFYFGGAYTVRSLSGATGIVGCVVRNHDLQLSYTFGLGKSPDVYWYDLQDGTLLSALNYKQTTIGVKYGYQVNLLHQLGFTPQVGFAMNKLGGTLTDEGTTKYGDGAKAYCATVGVRLFTVPVQHCYLFVAPEYSFCVSRDAYYKNVARVADFSEAGFAVSAGLLWSF